VRTEQQGEDKRMVMDLLRDNAILKKGVQIQNKRFQVGVWFKLTLVFRK